MTCPVCFTTDYLPYRLPCHENHIFCENCIKQLNPSACPLCRKIFDIRNTTQSYDFSFEENKLFTNPVDGQDVPSKHFGIIMNMLDWEQLAKMLNENGIKF